MDDPQQPTSEAEMRGSLALPFDPDDSGALLEKDITVPITPIEDKTPAAPLLWGLGAVLILGLLAALVVISAADDPQLNNFEPQPTAAVCQVMAGAAVNVRAGPGYEYARIWVLAAGQPRLVEAQAGTAWLRLANGWIPKSEVRSSATVCQQLPQETTPRLFLDDIAVPDAVLELGWSEILSENFALDLNGWVVSGDAAQVAVRDGVLVLYAATYTQPAQAYPSLAPAYQPLTDAYYALSGQWVATDGLTELSLAVRVSAAGAYQLIIRRDGQLTLQRLDELGRAWLLEEVLDSQLRASSFTLGLVNNGTELRVYVNQDLLFRTQDENLQAGTYALGLRGEVASAHVTRFEVRVPR